MSIFKKVKNGLKKFFNRLYSDFLMPSRLPAYESLLKEALHMGYEIYSVFSFWLLIKDREFDSSNKYLILRHDIDTDLATTKEMWKIEQRLGVEASYYFRLSTIDVSLMQLIHNSGSEASYHYEEIAAYCKQYKLLDPAHVHINMDDIRNVFKENYLSLKKQTGLPMNTVASHGDFVNRKLGIPNTEILQDTKLRSELGILLEVYDESFMKYVTKRYSDTLAPSYWIPEHPLQAFKTNEQIVYILTHPRHWRKNVRENFSDNIKRFWEGILYQIGR